MAWFISNPHCYFCFAEAETVDWLIECNKLGKKILSFRVGKRQAAHGVSRPVSRLWARQFAAT
jgi:hypothetical protein